MLILVIDLIIILFFGACPTCFNSFKCLDYFPITVFLLISGFFQEYTIKERQNYEFSGTSVVSNINLKLLLNNKKARLPIIIGLMFKLIILIGDLLSYKFEGKHLFDGQIIIWLFVSPLMIYTYVFNNIWGFWKSIWLNLELRIGNYKPMVIQGFRYMVLPLIIDAVITIPILLSSWNDFQFILLFYLTSSCYLFSTSFLWSLIVPRKITTTFQMKGSTSTLSSLTSAAGVLILATIKMNYWFYVLIPVFLILAGIALSVSIDIYRDKKYLLTAKILKG